MGIRREPNAWRPRGRRGNHPDFNDSHGPLRGIKRDLYEIARWPGRIEPGTSTDHPSAFWDFLPTACDLAGVEIPDGIDGISYLPTLPGRDDQRPHDYLYWEFHIWSEGKMGIAWVLEGEAPRGMIFSRVRVGDDLAVIFLDARPYWRRLP